MGSLIGGQMYKHFGGAKSFRIFAIGALVTCVLHFLLRPSIDHVEQVKSKLGEYQPPIEQQKNGVHAMEIEH